MAVLHFLFRKLYVSLSCVWNGEEGEIIKSVSHYDWKSQTNFYLHKNAHSASFSLYLIKLKHYLTDSSVTSKNKTKKFLKISYRQ